MKLVKLFKYTELPEDISGYILKTMIELIGDDDYSAFEFIVGDHFTEVEKDVEVYGEEAKTQDYYLDKKAFEWFRDTHGIEMFEKIYIKR